MGGYEEIWEPNICPACATELNSLSIIRAEAFTFDRVDGCYVRSDVVDTEVYIACECGFALDNNDVEVENSPNWREVKP